MVSSKYIGQIKNKVGLDKRNFRYDATAEPDIVTISRIAELAREHNVTMTEVSLAWLLTKSTLPIVGAAKPHHIEGLRGRRIWN